jgi:hypothetical protein
MGQSLSPSYLLSIIHHLNPKYPAPPSRPRSSDVSIVHPHMGKLGWAFASPSEKDETDQVLEMQNATGDKLYGSKHVRDLYFKAEKGELVVEWSAV